MTSIILAFLMLIIMKSIIEPVATKIGRKLIANYIEDACEILDNTLEMVGLDFDPEETVRHYLDMEGSDLSERQIQRIVEATFAEWDLRQVACSNKNA